MKLIKVKDIRERICSVENTADVVVAILRRGIIPATIYSINHTLPIHMILPADTHCQPIWESIFTYHNPLFIDDIIAEGRTYEWISSIMGKRAFQFMAAVKDVSFKPKKNMSWLFEEDEWVYFEWEEKGKVVEQDRGLFRDRSSSYGK